MANHSTEQSSTTYKLLGSRAETRGKKKSVKPYRDKLLDAKYFKKRFYSNVCAMTVFHDVPALN